MGHFRATKLVDVLVELVDEAEDVSVVLLEKLFEPLPRGGARGLVVGDPAPNKGLVDLGVEIIAVAHRFQCGGRQVQCRDFVQRAVRLAAAAGRAHVIVDECFGH